jgi:hypothetical protein
MGMLFSSLWGRLFSSKEMRILILGLDGAGKTTILCASSFSGSMHSTFVFFSDLSLTFWRNSLHGFFFFFFFYP